MNMNRLRNVAVRIRPLANTPAVERDPARDPVSPQDVVQPRRPSREDVAPTSKRQIWDMERADSPAVAPDVPHRTALDRGDPHAAGVPATTAATSRPGSGRAKTRVLGFHAHEFEADAFGAADVANKGPQFPAGFLVIIDGPGRGAFFAVTTSVSSIGRAAHQDVALDFGDESISREGHASVVYDGEQNRFFLGHGNKANVVRRNGTPVLTTEEMTHGDLIRIGKTSLRFHAFCGDDFTWTDTDQTSDATGRHE